MSIDSKNGVEIDLRAHSSRPGEIYLAHDPWTNGPLLSEWLETWKVASDHTGTLILNTKEDGLEKSVFEVLKQYGVTDFFFLDTAFPTLVRWLGTERSEHFAVRVSCHESLDWLGSLSRLPGWVWVDCFDGEPVPNLSKVPDGVRKCLVSPELQGGESSRLDAFLTLAHQCDAICTKNPDSWKKALES